MANIAVKKDDPRTLSTGAGTQEWEPSRFIRQFFGFDPFRQMAPLARSDEQTFIPSFEVKETKDGYLFKADVPGLKERDVEITLTQNRLTVSGKRDAEKEEKSDTYYIYERNYGSFSRSFTLPADIDQAGIHADIRDGVLTIHVPRSAAAQPRKIPVQSESRTKS